MTQFHKKYRIKLYSEKQYSTVSRQYDELHYIPVHEYIIIQIELFHSN
jgi:hypothetical protein